MPQIAEESEAKQKAPSGFSFRTWHLFYLTALIAIGLQISGVYSLTISSVVLVAWWMWHRKGTPRAIVVVAVVVGVSTGILFLSAEPASTPSRRSISTNNMKQCVLAMLAYKSLNGQFPPACPDEEAGELKHSWRVWILPYLECTDLYSQYNFDEPWNSPNNAKLVDQMPGVFQSPYLENAPGKTTYKFVFDEDCTSDVVLIEDASNAVNWMKPSDISIRDTVFLRENEHHTNLDKAVSAKRGLVRIFALEDGSVNHIDPKLLRRAIPVSNQSTLANKLGGYIALGLYVFLLALPGWFLKRRSAE